MRRYTEEEKQKYCRLSDEIGWVRVCNEYGINRCTLAKWKNPAYRKKCIENTKQWRINNRQRHLIKCKEWQVNNREQNQLLHQKYYNSLKNDPIKYKEKMDRDILRNNDRYKKDINFRILCVLRSRLLCALKETIKQETTKELLGCTIEELKEYLSKQFMNGMTWDNYGEWHIDHIKPCSSFNMLIEEERKRCFHYTNLQPLWAIDNIKKSNKI